MTLLKGIFFIIFISLITACSSKKSLLIGEYDSSNIEGPQAEINFVPADPYVYFNSVPAVDKKVIIEGVLGSYKDFYVKLFDDPANCTNYQMMSMKKENESFFPISSGSTLTFRVLLVEKYDKRRAFCPTTFSFTPKEGAKYTAKLDIHSNEANDASCRVKLYKEGEVVKIIARNNIPFRLVSSSPSCDLKELEEPKWVDEMRFNFMCSLRGGFC